MQGFHELDELQDKLHFVLGGTKQEEEEEDDEDNDATQQQMRRFFGVALHIKRMENESIHN